MLGAFKWLTSALASLANIFIAPFHAMKTVLIGLVGVGIPVAVGKMLHGKSDLIFDKGMEYLNGWGIAPQVLEITGVLAWFCQQLRIAEVVGILLTALVIRFTLKLSKGAFKFAVLGGS